MNNRVKNIRNALKLNQEDFGQKLGITKSAVSGYEIGRRNLTDQTILAICREFNVNEEWLRDGSGEMFVLTQDDEFLALQNKYNLDPLDIKIMKEYLKLTPEHRNVFKNYFVNVFCSDTKSNIVSEDERIDLEVDAYRKELEAQKHFSTSEVLPTTNDAKKQVG